MMPLPQNPPIRVVIGDRHGIRHGSRPPPRGNRERASVSTGQWVQRTLKGIEEKPRDLSLSLSLYIIRPSVRPIRADDPSSRNIFIFSFKKETLFSFSSSKSVFLLES